MEVLVWIIIADDDFPPLGDLLFGGSMAAAGLAALVGDSLGPQLAAHTLHLSPPRQQVARKQKGYCTVKRRGVNSGRGKINEPIVQQKRFGLLTQDTYKPPKHRGKTTRHGLTYHEDAPVRSLNRAWSVFLPNFYSFAQRTATDPEPDRIHTFWWIWIRNFHYQIRISCNQCCAPGSGRIRNYFQVRIQIRN